MRWTAPESHLNREELELMICAFSIHMVISRPIFVGQARLNFRKVTQNPNALVFLLSSIIWHMDR